MQVPYESIDQNILYEFATDDMDELLQVVQDILKVNDVDDGHGVSFIQTSKL